MKKVLVLIISLFVFICLNQVEAVGEKSVQLAVKDETTIGADFSSGIYAYQLERKFTKSPNTIEVWMRLGKLHKGQTGGVVFSNNQQNNYNSVSLEIDENRHIYYVWNGGQAQITFDEYELVTDEWAHISVVRDVESEVFNLYVDGNLVQSVAEYIGTDPVTDFRYIVGCDWMNWNYAKNPFKGEIGQVTVYSSSRTSKEVYEDYLFSDEISSDNRENLLFNAEFTLGCEKAIDTSSNKNNATIRSNDFFYDGDVYEAKDYTLAIIPDPQIMARWRQDTIPSISEYLIDYNTKNSGKVAMTICVGDNMDNYSGSGHTIDEQLGAIKAEYDRLRNAGIRWVTTPGNHDYDDNFTKSRDLTHYNRYFTYAELSTYDYWGGAYAEGQTQNAYYKFEVAGIKYLVISVEFGADNSVLAWANGVVSNHQDHRVIVYSHALIGADGEVITAGKPHGPATYGYAKIGEVNNSHEIYEKFILKHKNIFMAFCGHVGSDDILKKELVGENGNIVSSFLIDAQGVMCGGGDSILGMLTIDELNQTVGVNYVSTSLRKLYNVHNQFEYSFKGHTDILSSIYYNADGSLKAEYK